MASGHITTFSYSALEQFASVLCNLCTHDELTQEFGACRFDHEEVLGLSKPKRIARVLSHEQDKVGSGVCVLRFIREIVTQDRFVDNRDGFNDTRVKLNKVLLLHGLEYTEKCEFKWVERAQTLDEIDQRINGLVGKLRQGGCHPEVLKYCTHEFMGEDYFHGILEAAKGVCQRLRDMTGLMTDGADLINMSFGVKHPILAFNTLMTESEQSEQKGIVSLFLGCHQFLRNPRAHAPRKLWHDEVNVLGWGLTQQRII